MMINPHALIYSSHQDITIWNLKESNYDPSIDTTLVANWMASHDVDAIVEWDQNYPNKISNISSNPYILYYQWNIDLLKKPILGIVGPRNHTDFAKSIVQKIINQAINHDLVTISGLASGVDQLAHRFSLGKNIPTIAVLGWWFSPFLKSKDRDLIQKIVSNWWLILSEFKLSQKPQTYTYPQRNRIIAGLSDVLFLPEACKKSWSLITVDFAKKQQKPIYGTPNLSSPSMSDWLHEYLQNWIVRPLLDIKSMLNLHFPKDSKIAEKEKVSLLSTFDPDTQKLLEIIQNQSQPTISTLLQQWFSTEKIYPALARLEMENIIHQPAPGVYSIT